MIVRIRRERIDIEIVSLVVNAMANDAANNGSGLREFVSMICENV